MRVEDGDVRVQPAVGVHELAQLAVDGVRTHGNRVGLLPVDEDVVDGQRVPPDDSRSLPHVRLVRPAGIVGELVCAQAERAKCCPHLDRDLGVVLHEPEEGLDVGAQHFVGRLAIGTAPEVLRGRGHVRQARQAGIEVVLASGDLGERVEVADDRPVGPDRDARVSGARHHPERLDQMVGPRGLRERDAIARGGGDAESVGQRRCPPPEDRPVVRQLFLDADIRIGPERHVRGIPLIRWDGQHLSPGAQLRHRLAVREEVCHAEPVRDARRSEQVTGVTGVDEVGGAYITVLHVHAGDAAAAHHHVEQHLVPADDNTRFAEHADQDPLRYAWLDTPFRLSAVVAAHPVEEGASDTLHRRLGADVRCTDPARHHAADRRSLHEQDNIGAVRGGRDGCGHPGRRPAPHDDVRTPRGGGELEPVREVERVGNSDGGPDLQDGHACREYRRRKQAPRPPRHAATPSPDPLRAGFAAGTSGRGCGGTSRAVTSERAGHPRASDLRGKEHHSP